MSQQSLGMIRSTVLPLGLLEFKLQLVQFDQSTARDPGNTSGISATEADEMGEFTLKGLTRPLDPHRTEFDFRIQERTAWAGAGTRRRRVVRDL